MQLISNISKAIKCRERSRTSAIDAAYFEVNPGARLSAISVSCFYVQAVDSES